MLDAGTRMCMLYPVHAHTHYLTRSSPLPSHLHKLSQTLQGVEQVGEVQVHGVVHVLHEACLHELEHEHLGLELVARALVQHVR